MPQHVVNELEQHFSLKSIEAASTQESGLIHHGDLIVSAFEHMYDVRKSARERIVRKGLIGNLGDSDYEQEQRLADLTRGVEIGTMNKLSKAVAGMRFLVRSHPEHFAILDSESHFTPYATGMVPANNPSYFRSPLTPNGFHLQSLETGERLTVIPLNPHGVPIVSLQEVA